MQVSFHPYETEDDFWCMREFLRRTAISRPLLYIAETSPAHQKRGLGKALMTGGLRRLQRIGATRAFVGGYNVAAIALYRSVMGSEHELYEVWVKEWLP